MEAPELQAGTHHLRVRQPAGQMADRARGGSLPRRARALSPPGRMTVIIGAALAANALLVALASRSAASCSSTSWPARCSDRPAAVFYDQLLTYLQRGQQVLLWLGSDPGRRRLVRGPQPYRTAARATVAGGLETVGSLARRRPGSGTGHWVAANAPWLRFAVGRPGRRRPAVGQRRLAVAAVLVRAPRRRAAGGHPGPRGCRRGERRSASLEGAVPEAPAEPRR